ncbi:phage tail tape measure protein [Kingella kingae]|uniref:phage tail tape measure protein n=1 Tax=Kingella kingae TaxID=504 RepID=UPI00254C3211|nr:phage tail tape measure protein [Kingella kingae]MDK4537915.1 phage tail tape measure protein [Kingella kingae]MDK4547056.1 phage tail tape measure protein [Kingella kingae]MDK4622850.1 phage tail tape measure protein [Kingella kingae]
MASDLSLSISVSAVVGGALSGLTNIGKAMNTLKSTTTNLTTKQKELGDSLERNKDRLSSTSAAHLWRQYNQVGEAIDKLTRKHEQLAKIAARKIGNQEQWQNLKGQWQSAVASAGTLVLPIKLAIDFESAMADVKKVVDFDTPEQFKQMGQDIVAMTRQIPMSANELAKIVALGGQSGIAQDQLLRFANSAAKMGVAFDVSAEKAGQSMAELRSAFQLDQSGVETLADKINYLGNTTPAAAKGIMEIVQRVGAFGTVAGYNTGTVAALGATMRGFGIQEEIAATSIKNMMLALVAGETATKSQKAAWKKLGFDHEKIAKDMQKDAEGTTLKVLEAVSKLEKHEQASTLKQLFGSESLLGIAPLLTSIDTVKKNLEGVKNAANFDGSMNKEYEARAATTANNIQLLKNSLTGLGITVGTMLLPAVNRFVVLSTSVVNALTDWAQQHPVLTQAIVGTTAAILAFISGGFVIRVLGNRMMAVLLSVRGGFAALSASITAVRAVMQGGVALSSLEGNLGKVIRAFTTVCTAIMAFSLSSAMAFAPVLLAIAAVAAAAALIYIYWKPIKAFFIGFWDGFKDGIAPIMPLLEMIGAGWKGLFDLAVAFVQPIIAWFRELGLVSDETAQKSQSIGYFFGAMLGTLLGNVQAIGGAIINGWRMIFDSLFNVVFMVIEQVKSVWQGGLSNMVALVMNWAILGAIRAILNAIAALFGGEVGRWASYGANMIDGLINGISAGIGRVVAMAQNLAARVKGAFTGAMQIHSPSRVFRSYGGFMTEGLAIGVNKGADKPIGKIRQLASNLKNRFAERMSGFRSDLSARLSANADNLSQARAEYSQAQFNNGGAMTIHFNPTININGGGNMSAQMQQGLQMSLYEFEKTLERVMAEKIRRAY